MKTSLSEIYDEFAKTYDENRGLFDLSKIFEEFYKNLNTENGDLLDLGCGTGEAFSKFFIDKGWQATGVDFSREMLVLANQYVPQMKTIHADIRQVEFEENSFDVVVAVYSLFHLPTKDHPQIFANIRKWLRSDGRALFTYATKQYTGNDEFEGYINFLGKDLYYSHTTPEKLFTLLTEVGLIVENKQFIEIGGETFLWVSVSKQP